MMCRFQRRFVNQKQNERCSQDESAFWLNLKGVYWPREGRVSIDAVILFGALLAVGSWGAPTVELDLAIQRAVENHHSWLNRAKQRSTASEGKISSLLRC
jgi:hypothetical protein